MLEPKEFEQGIEYALANDCDGLQVDTWNIVDTIMDFRLFEKVANQIVFLSFMNVNTTNVSNFEYIYSLERLKTFYCQKVDLHIDFARFSSLRNIGIFYNKNFLVSSTLAVSNIRNRTYTNCEVYLIDYGYGDFKEKIHFME